MTEADSAELAQLRREVKTDIELAIANFKIWLLLTVLTNVVLIGVPALYVFFNTTSVAQSASLKVDANNAYINDQKQWNASVDQRLIAIERHLQAKDDFEPHPAESLPK